MAHILRDEPSAVFEYDGQADALYYRLTCEHVARTVSVGDRVAVDVDDEGRAVGIEVLNPPGFSVTVSPQRGARAAVDFIAKGHLGTPCPRPKDGGMCGCDEDDDAPKVCLGRECDCV